MWVRTQFVGVRTPFFWVRTQDPALQQPMYRRLLPLLLQHAAFPEDFTTWEECVSVDREAFDSFRCKHPPPPHTQPSVHRVEHSPTRPCIRRRMRCDCWPPPLAGSRRWRRGSRRRTTC